MDNLFSDGDTYISLLSGLVIGGYNGDFSKPAENLQPLYSELEQVASLSEERFIEFLKLADMHHVTVRALRVVRKFAAEQNKKQLEDRCDTALRAEKASAQ